VVGSRERALEQQGSDAEPGRLIHDLSNELSVLVHYGGFVADGLDELEIGAPLAASDLEQLRAHVGVLRGAIERTAELAHSLRAALRPPGEHAAGAGPVPAQGAAPAEPLPGPDRPAHILVAEDDDAVRALAVRILGRAGYRVTTASSGREAFELLAGLDGQVDLVLTDLRMADVSGPELDARIRSVWPTMRTLFMSGYRPEPNEPGGDLDVDASARLIEKPFTVEELLAKVGEALQGGD
jgi:CheY-like chemotaxis protein